MNKKDQTKAVVVVGLLLIGLVYYITKKNQEGYAHHPSLRRRSRSRGRNRRCGIDRRTGRRVCCRRGYRYLAHRGKCYMERWYRKHRKRVRERLQAQIAAERAAREAEEAAAAAAAAAAAVTPPPSQTTTTTPRVVTSPGDADGSCDIPLTHIQRESRFKYGYSRDDCTSINTKHACMNKSIRFMQGADGFLHTRCDWTNNSGIVWNR